MAKLPKRYTKQEFATMTACIKPYEKWIATERKRWAVECYGFRHFVAPNITPIEYYWPKPPAHPGLWQKLTSDAAGR